MPVSDRPPKLKWLAMGLNFLLPGAGLAYLGLWRGALVNLAVALAVFATVSALLSPAALGEFGPMIGSGVAGGSLGVAYAAYDRLFGPASGADGRT